MDENRIKKLVELGSPEPVGDLLPYVKLLLFGTHGSWKTTTACQIGGHRGRVLLHHTDDDWKSLLNHPEVEQNVDRIPFKSPLQTKLISEALRDQVPPYDQYATFVFDTVGGWVDDFIETLLNDVEYSDKNARTRVSGKGTKGNQFVRDMNLTTTEFTDFNLAKMQLRPIVRNLIQAPVNVVFIAHDRVAENDKGRNWKHIRPDIPEQCFNVVVRKCDALGFFKKEGDIPKVSFKDAKNVTTKSRLGVLNGKEIPAPQVPEIINNWLERK